MFITSAISEIKTDLRSYFYWDATYYNEIQTFQGETKKAEPFSRLMGGVGFYTWPANNLMLKFTPEFKSSTQLPLRPADPDNFSPPSVSHSAYLDVGKAVWIFGNLKKPSWRASFGWQYYKDNPHTHILGDYLIKSMIYPSLVFTRIHRSDTHILGLLVENPGDMFRQNFIVHSNFQQYPFADISLAYSASINLREKFEIGAGVHWVSAVPIRPSRTTPRGGDQADDNIYKEVPFQEGTAVTRDSTVDKVISIRLAPDTTGFADVVVVDNISGRTDSMRVELLNGKFAGLSQGLKPSDGGYGNPGFSRITENNDGYELFSELNGSETRYSFSGQIITLRTALNLLSGESGLGSDPFKIYAEAALLGFKNYDGFYEERSERMPVLLGINLPTLNFLDHLALEVEMFENKKAPSWLRRFRRGVPQPGGELQGYDQEWTDPDRQQKDDLKWGVSARKSIQGFALSVQGGTDHSHSHSGDDRFHEILSRPAHWYVSTRFIVKI